MMACDENAADLRLRLDCGHDSGCVYCHVEAWRAAMAYTCPICRGPISVQLLEHAEATLAAIRVAHEVHQYSLDDLLLLGCSLEEEAATAGASGNADANPDEEHEQDQAAWFSGECVEELPSPSTTALRRSTVAALRRSTVAAQPVNAHPVNAQHGYYQHGYYLEPTMSWIACPLIYAALAVAQGQPVPDFDAGEQFRAAELLPPILWRSLVNFYAHRFRARGIGAGHLQVDHPRNGHLEDSNQEDLLEMDAIGPLSMGWTLLSAIAVDVRGQDQRARIEAGQLHEVRQSMAAVVNIIGAQQFCFQYENLDP